MAKKRNEDKPNKPLEPTEEIALPPEEVVDLDSVFNEDLSTLRPGEKDEAVSGIFSSIERIDADSAVNPPSEIIRGEPLSDSVAIEPMAEFAATHADSDVHVEPIGPDDDLVEVVDDVTEDRVLHDEKPHSSSTGGVALPESAILKQGPPSDAIDIGELGGVIDSSVSLKSFKNVPRSPEKEQIVDLDEAVEPIDDIVEDEIVEDEIVEVDDAAEFEGDRSDADMVADGASQETEAIDFGDKSVASTQGYDPLVESLESGVRLEEDTKPPVRGKKSPTPAPSVEFDDLVVDDVEVEEISGPATPRPAKVPSLAADMGDSDEIDIADMLGDDETAKVDEIAAEELATDEVTADTLAADEVVDDAMEPTDLEAPVADEDLIEAEPEPVASAPARRGKKAALVTEPAADLPYQEPKRGGGWGGLVGGAVVGLLLAAGAAGGVWFAAPDLIPQSPKGQAAVAQLAEAKKAEESAKEEAKKAVDDKQKAETVIAAFTKTLVDAKQLDEKDKLDSKVLDKLVKEVGEAKKAEEVAKDEVKKATDDKEKAETLIAGVTKTLVDAKQLDEKDKLDPKVIDKLVKDVEGAKTTLAAVDKLLDSVKAGMGEKGVEKLVAEKKDADEKLTEVAKALDDAKVKDPGAKGVVEIAASRDKIAKDREDLEQTVKSAFKELLEGKLVPADADPRKVLAEGAKSARLKSESPLAGPLSSLAGSLGSLTVGMGDATKDAFRQAELVAEIGFLRTRDALTPSPGRQLDRLAMILENPDEKDAAVLIEATNLADWALADKSTATNQEKAKARWLRALVARGKGDFDTARKEADTVKDEVARWSPRTRQTYREILDPAAFYLPRIEKLRSDENYAAALKEIDSALKALPDSARLKAERSTVSLELLRMGKEDPNAAQAIRADAEEALKNPKTFAAAAVTIGKLAESTGNAVDSQKAEELYRQALKSGDADETQSAELRLGLGRLLLRKFAGGGGAIAAPVPPKAPAVEPEPKEEPKEEPKVEPKVEPKAAPKAAPKEPLKAEPKAEPKVEPKEEPKEEPKLDPKEPKAAPKEPLKVEPKAEPKVEPKEEPKEEPKIDPKKDEPKEEARISTGSSRFGMLVRLVAAASIAQPPVADSEDVAPELKEAIDLARQLLAESKDKRTKVQAQMLLGDALSRAGRKTEGLREYAKGLEMLQPGANFLKLLDEHPAFQTSDSDLRANPILSEKHYGQGLHLYREGRFIEAESQFKQALGYFDKDARYWYWIGLCQIEQPSQSKRESAVYSWEQASRLEANSRPTTDEVNRSLERIQGPRRVLLDSYRSRSVAQ